MKYTWLPQLLREIAEVAGLDAALALAAARGGQRVRIPAAIADQDHWLVQTVGIDAATAICEMYRGGSHGADLEIPVGPAGLNSKVGRQIKELIDAGASSNEIVRRTGVVFRTVTRHRAKARNTDKRQGRLF